MDGNRKQKSDVVIRFNGERHSLEEWTKKETAAEKEKLLEWDHAFSGQMDLQAKPGGQNSNSPSEHLSYPKEIKSGRIKGKLDSLPVRLLRTIRIYWLPGAAAIVIGLVIGLTMLTVFSGKEETGSTVWGKKSGIISSGSNTVKVQSGSLDLSVYLVQAGVFSTRAKADQVSQGLRKEGFAAVTAGNNPTAVLIGAASSKNGAAQLESFYKSRDISVYQKYLQIRPQSTQILKNNTLAAATLKVKTFISTLLMASGESYSGQKTISTATAHRLENILADWKGADNNMSGNIDKQLNGSLEAAADHALVQVQALQHKGTVENYYSLQQSLLEIIALYQSLLLGQ